MPASPWVGALQSLDWSPLFLGTVARGRCPPVSSGTATRGAVESCCTLGNESLKKKKKTPCNTWWREVEKDSPKSSLGSLRGVTSPSLPTVVAGSSMDCRCTGSKGKVSDVSRQRRQRRGADIAISHFKASVKTNSKTTSKPVPHTSRPSGSQEQQTPRTPYK